MRSKAIYFVALVMAFAPLAATRVHCCHRHHHGKAKVQVSPPAPPTPPAPESPLDRLEHESF